MAMLMKTVLALVLLAGIASARNLVEPASDRLTCVTTATRDSTGQELKIASISSVTNSKFSSVQSSVASQGEAVCIKMQVKCAEGYNSQLCTKSETEANAWKWAHMASTRPVCNYYETEAVKSGIAKDVYCCTTNNCNA